MYDEGPSGTTHRIHMSGIDLFAFTISPGGVTKLSTGRDSGHQIKLILFLVALDQPASIVPLILTLLFASERVPQLPQIWPLSEWSKGHTHTTSPQHSRLYLMKTT